MISDCRMYGHPVVTGAGCPCGEVVVRIQAPPLLDPALTFDVVEGALHGPPVPGHRVLLHARWGARRARGLG